MLKPKKQSPKKISKSGKKKQFGSVGGMSDILPKESVLWKAIWNAGETVSDLHNFHFINTPIVERAALFESAIGKGTPLVDNGLYTFKARNQDVLSLRPEGTAALMRSYLEHQLGRFSSPLQVYYHGPMYRYGGRGESHQFYEWSYNTIGDGDSFYDAGIIVVFLDFLNLLGFKNPILKLNAVGCKVCRPTYSKKLKEYYRRHKKDICDDCRANYAENPVLLLNCLRTKCIERSQKTPIVLNYLCQSCNNHLKNLLELIEDNEINYIPDPLLPPPSLYFSRVVFKIYAGEEDDEALVSGGRYDYLSERIGGRPLQATGGVLHVNKTMDRMKEMGISGKPKKKRRVFFVAVGERAKKSSLSVMRSLRENGIITMEAFNKKSLNAQLRAANRNNAPLILIYGQKEVFEKKIMIREVESASQESILLEKMVEEVKRRLR